MMEPDDPRRPSAPRRIRPFRFLAAALLAATMTATATVSATGCSSVRKLPVCRAATEKESQTAVGLDGATGGEAESETEHAASTHGGTGAETETGPEPVSETGTELETKQGEEGTEQESDAPAPREPEAASPTEYTGAAHAGTDIYYVGHGANRDRIIAIDPGHQQKGEPEQEPIGPGSDRTKARVTGGARGVCTGIPEHELNLRVALYLRDELIRRGYSVVMIRETSDVSVSNMERALIANRHRSAAFVRLHANSWTDSRSRGALAVCHSADNPYPDCAATYQDSLRLSHEVLDGFCAQAGMTRLHVLMDDELAGTNWSQTPTTLLEMGFLSNESDDRLMATDEFRKKAAAGIADGLDRYFRGETAGNAR